MRGLEKKLRIIYTIDTHASVEFGYLRFVITVKFKDKKPDLEVIEKLFKNEPNVQLVMSTKGEFDLFIIVLFENHLDIESWLYKIRKTKVFLPYRAFWNVSYLMIGHGAIQLRDEFFREIVEKRVWYRTKEEPRRKPDQIFKREYAVLRALSSNSRISFKKIDEEYKLGEGAANSTYHNLLDRSIIIRPTISM